MPKLELEHSPSASGLLSGNHYQVQDFDFDNQGLHIELER